MHDHNWKVMHSAANNSLPIVAFYSIRQSELYGIWHKISDQWVHVLPINYKNLQTRYLPCNDHGFMQWEFFMESNIYFVGFEKHLTGQQQLQKPWNLYIIIVINQHN